METGLPSGRVLRAFTKHEASMLRIDAHGRLLQVRHARELACCATGKGRGVRRGMRHAARKWGGILA